MNKYDKKFNEQYKDMAIACFISIFGGLLFIIITVFSEWLDKISPIILTFGSS